MIFLLKITMNERYLIDDFTRDNWIYFLYVAAHAEEMCKFNIH